MHHSYTARHAVTSGLKSKVRGCDDHTSSFGPVYQRDQQVVSHSKEPRVQRSRFIMINHPCNSILLSVLNSYRINDSCLRRRRQKAAAAKTYTCKKTRSRIMRNVQHSGCLLFISLRSFGHGQQKQFRNLCRSAQIQS